MNYTENYQLTQWEPSDRVLREDFNRDNATIDAALKAAHESIRIVHGTFTGDGTAERVIALEFAPKLMLLAGFVSNNSTFGIITPDSVTQISSSTSVQSAADVAYFPALEGAQLRIRHADWFNKSGTTTYYTLIG